MNKCIQKKHFKNIILGVCMFAMYFLHMESLIAQTFVTSVEAEIGTLAGGLTIGTSKPGYSGTGYVTSMINSGDNLSFPVTVSSAGIYKLVIRYNGPYGDKFQDVYVNGTFVSNLSFPATTGYTDLTAGSLLLKAGANTISIYKSWGYTDFDKITLYTVPLHDYTTVVAAPIDPAATPEAIALYNYLKSNYGKSIISGQTADYYMTISPNVAKKPVIRDYDFQHYTVGYPYAWNNATASHTFGWTDNGATEAAIKWYDSTCQKGIVAFQWHWCSPFGGIAGTNTFAPANTTFDVSKAVITGTAEYTAVIRDIDSIATQLKKLQTAGVPVMWRPLHEAGGAWFWWGTKGSAAALALYDIMYNRLVNYHGIHNLIWQWSTPEASWYPGNAKVDMLGYDSYPGAYNYGTQKLIFDQLYDIVGGKKMLALTENGPIPDPDALFTSDAKWSYFMSWDDLAAKQNSPAQLSLVYNHSKVITLDEVATGTNTAQLTAAGPTSFCAGGNVLLKANVAKGYTYKWYKDNAVISGATASTYSASLSGSYKVDVTATGACTTTSSAIVVNTSGPSATITAGGPLSFCSGGNVTLNASTGTGYAYQWLNGGTNISGETSASYVAKTTGVYSVKVTSGSCTNTSLGTTVAVNAIPTIPVITVSGVSTFCSGWKTQLNVTYDLGSTLVWLLNGTTAANQSQVVTTGGSYSVTSTKLGCSATSAPTVITVTPLPIPTITAGSATSFCQGGSVVLTASTGTSYQWYNGATLLTGETTAKYTANATGNYNVKVFNPNGCDALSASTTVTANALPTIIGTLNVCTGMVTQLTGSGTANASSPWSSSNTAIATVSNTGVVTGQSEGTSIVKYTNNAGCTAIATILVNAKPTATITKGPNTACQGINVLLTASAGKSYKWMLNGTSINGETNATFNAGSTGPYTVEITNASNCKATSSPVNFPIESLVQTSITPSGTIAICNGGNVLLTASAGSAYKWMLDGAAIKNATNATYTASAVGVYTVEVTSGTNNCKSISTPTTVRLEPSLMPIITTTGPTTICPGLSVAMSASTPGPYQWMRNGTAISGEINSTYTANSTGSYTVEVRSAANCKLTAISVAVVVTNTVTWYADTDKDGKGDPNTSIQSCTQPVGYVSEAGDACPLDANKISPGNCGCGVTENSCLDCIGVPNGTASLDICNVCSGGTTGITPKTSLAQCTATATKSALATNLKIYPNPTSDISTIELIGSEFTVTIYSASGVELSQKQFNGNAIIGNDLSQGMYLIRIEQDGSVELRKLIKQ